VSTIAVDVGGTNFKIAYIGPGGDVVRFARVPHHSAPADLDHLADTLRSWVDGSTRAVGFAVPGVVDGGRLRSAHGKVGYLVGLDLHAWADAELGLPAHVENDARAACWGEYRSGAGRGVADLLTVSLGTGVGVGAVVAGALLHGAHGHGAILAGHVPSAEGPDCNCGGRGCVEARASGWVAHGAPDVPEDFLAAWALATRRASS
jgi:glucokinase